ncbi:MAG: hypothetical protein Q9216_002607 [Gyalolechia sp. 2 TL-2023]
MYSQLFSIAALATLAFAQNETMSNSSSTMSLADLLGSTESLSSLADAVNGVPGLAETLGAATDITILAPSNEAFATFMETPSGQAVSTDDSTAIQALLQYHIINGTYPASAVMETPAFLSTMLNNSAYANVTGGQVVEAVRQGEDVVFYSGLLSNATVTTADQNFTGGVVHIIDTVLTVPQNVSSTAIAAGLSGIAGALTRADVVDIVDSLSDITVFAPNNSAFQAIGSALPNLTLNQLVDILQYHTPDEPQLIDYSLTHTYTVINGTVAYSSMIEEEMSVPALSGGDLMITMEDGDVFVNSARVLIPDVLVANGVIHVIDNVLNPNNTEAMPDPTASVQTPAFSGATSAENVDYTSGVPTPTMAIGPNPTMAEEDSSPTMEGGAEETGSAEGAAPQMMTGAMGAAALFAGAGHRKAMAKQYDTHTTVEVVVQDLSREIAGKVVLTTGISPGGLGAYFNHFVAPAKPALLILAGRNHARNQASADSLSQDHPDVPVRTLQLDLESLDKVRDAAATVNGWSGVPRIDVLVNNAGVMACEYERTADRFERQFAVSHIGPLLFTNLLMPKILASEAPRIVNVSSDGHRLSQIRWPDVGFSGGQLYNKWRAYGQGKTANILFSVALAKRLGSKGLTAVSLHPGVIGTNLSSHLDWDTEFAALPSDYNASYLQDAHIADPSAGNTIKAYALDRIEADKLWQLSEKLVGQRGGGVLPTHPPTYLPTYSINPSTALYRAIQLDERADGLTIPSEIAEEHTIATHFHSEQERIKIVHVGAGAAGLITAYKARRMLGNYELVCYDKNPDVGGTWFENTYPGVGCDVPSHSYTFSFEPNAEWDGYYANGAQIQKYLVDFCDKYDLRKFMRLETTVLGATWMDDKGQWELELRSKDGTRFQDRCHVLISGSGPLNRWKWPEIESIGQYKGTLVHTADWDSKIDWHGRRVAVIGSGASGVQVTPQLVKGAESFTLFSRSGQWITPPAGMQDIRVIPDSELSSHPAPAGKHFYTREEKAVMRTDPERFLKYRKGVDSAMQANFPIFLRTSLFHDHAMVMMTEMIKQRIGPGRPDLERLFIPSFSPGCRRNTCVSTEIVKFTEHGIMTADGKEREYDIVVCATGFDVAFAPHYQVTGRNGISMKKDWAEFPNVYLSVASPNFPNFYFIGGPTGNWAQGSVLATHEIQAEYALQCALKISAEHLHSLEPSQSVTTEYLQHVETWHRSKSVWAETCRSWVKYNGRVALWCGSMIHMLKTLRVPRWEDFVIRRRGGNMWSFLGDGRTEREVLHAEGKEVELAPWMRNEDSAWTVDL